MRLIVGISGAVLLSIEPACARLHWFSVMPRAGRNAAAMPLLATVKWRGLN
jgi:hypothetical protein